MAMSVTYGSFGGRIVSENRGGVERDYARDTLGSTAALMNSSGAKTDEWFYWPFGETRARTGTSSTPFTFVGTLGYFADSATRMYVRARSYLANLARWLTVDKVWPYEYAYAYARNRPVDWTDPTGLIAPQLLAALIAGLTTCVTSAIGSIFTGWFSGDSPAVAACKAAAKCIANGIRAAITVLFGPVVGCFVSALSGIAGLVADKLCPCISDPCCDKSLDWCDGVKLAADVATGCLGGFANDEFKESFGDWLGGALNGLINTITRGAAAKACKGAADLKRYW